MDDQEDITRRLDVQRRWIDSRGVYGSAQMGDLRQFVKKAEGRCNPTEYLRVFKHAFDLLTSGSYTFKWLSSFR